MPILTGLGFLAAMIPVITLWHADTVRVLFQGTVNGAPDGIGAYVVDQYALVLKALFLLTGYVVVLMSTNEIDETGGGATPNITTPPLGRLCVSIRLVMRASTSLRNAAEPS